MTKKEVIDLLKENKNPRGIENWKKHNSSHLESYGIGLTVLRKLAKKVGRNAPLAEELWEIQNHDAKIISLLINDPKTLTRQRVEQQVEQLHGGYLAHVFSSCNATLGKAPFVIEVIDDWIISDDRIRRCCGYGLLYELSKSKKKNAPGDDYFLAYLRHIQGNFHHVRKQELLSMGVAVQGIGVRNINLHKPALELANKIGPIDFNEKGQKCDPYDVAKHLTSSYVVEKFGLEL